MAHLSRWFSLIWLSKCSPTTPGQHARLVWALPVSLATTQGIIIIFFSSGYLDVSVPRVGSLLLVWCTFSTTGCPIRKSRDISLVCSSPWLIAAYHVLHRLLESRHPPYALICFKNINPSYHFSWRLSASRPTQHYSTQIKLLASFVHNNCKQLKLPKTLFSYYYLVYYNFPNMSKNLNHPSTPSSSWLP